MTLAAPLNNLAECGTAGADVTSANSGGASGAAWDVVSSSGPGAVVYDATHAHSGTLAYKITNSLAANNMLSWTTALGPQNELWGRVYLWFTAVPPTNVVAVWLLNGGNQVARVNVNASGKVEVRGAANTVLATSTNSVAVGQWIRIEWHCIPLASGGTIEARLFNTADGTTPTETVSATGALMTGITQVAHGQQATGNATAVVWYDDMQVNSTSWPGPSGVAVVNQWTKVTSTADGQLLTYPTAGNWLIAIVTCRVTDASTPTISVGDVGRNPWTLLATETAQASSVNSGAQIQAEVWACPAARYDGWRELAVYVSAMQIVADDVGDMCINVFEVSGMTTGYLTVEAIRIGTAALATSLSLAMPTPAANSLVIGTTATDNGTASAITNTGAGFTGLTQVSTTAPNLVMTSQWKQSTAAETISWSSGATSVNWAAVGVSLRVTGTTPVQPNPNWPAVAFQLGLGYDLNTPPARAWWTTLPKRFLELAGERGIQAELGAAQQGDTTIVLDNRDGAFSPRAAGSATSSGDGTTTTLLVPDSQATNVNVADFFQLGNTTTPLPAPALSDTFESGTLAAWPTLIGNVSAVAAAAYSGSFGARVNPGGGQAGQIATSTSKWTQGVYKCALVKAKIRFNTLPVGTTADTITLQAQTQLDNFDLFYNNTTNSIWFDLKGAVAWTDTGITPVLGRWYDVQAIVNYGTSTYTAQVMIDGKVFPLLSSPGETPSFIRSLHIGTSSTSKTFQFDVDEVSVTVSTGQLSFGAGVAGLKENTVFQVVSKASSAGTTTVTFKRADGTGGALAPTVTGDQYAGVPIDLYIPYRLLATWSGKTYIVASGWLRDLPITYDGAAYAEVQAAAADALETLTAANPSMLRGEILRRNPTQYWPLDDAGGVAYAANASGNSISILTQATSKWGSGANTTAGFGAATQDVDPGVAGKTSIIGDSGSGWGQDGLTAAELPTKGYALVGSDPAFPSITNGVTICGALLITDTQLDVITAASVNPTLLVVRNADPASGIGLGDVLRVSFDRSTLQAQVSWWDKDTHAITTVTGNGAQLSQVWRTWALTFNRTSWAMYVDGIASASGSCDLVANFTSINLGGEADQFANGRAMPATHAHIAVFGRRLSADEIRNHHNAVTTGEISEYAYELMARKLDTVGWKGTRVLTHDPDGQMGPEGAPSGTVADLMNEVAGYGDGLAFVDAGAQLQYRDRVAAYQQIPRATFGERTDLGEVPYQPGMSPSFNPTFLYNATQVENTTYTVAGVSSSTLVAVDDVSAGKYGARTLQRSTRFHEAAYAWRIGWWLLARYAYPAQRAETITIEASADPTRWPIVLGIEVGDIVIVNKRPLGAPMISLRCRVLQVKPHIVYGDGGQVSGSVTLTLAAAPDAVAIANDPVYGIVGNNVLGA